MHHPAVVSCLLLSPCRQAGKHSSVACHRPAVDQEIWAIYVLTGLCPVVLAGLTASTALHNVTAAGDLCCAHWPVQCHDCRAGSLYGELARFVLRLLGYKPKDKAPAQHLVPGTEGQPRPGPGGECIFGLQKTLLVCCSVLIFSLVCCAVDLACTSALARSLLLSLQALSWVHLLLHMADKGCLPAGANLPGLPGSAPQSSVLKAPEQGGSNWDNVWGR